MFYHNKTETRNALHLLQRVTCSYDGNHNPEPPSFCDCKYGYDGNSRGEDNACPELRTVVDLLDKMTEKEYNRILGIEQGETMKLKVYLKDGVVIVADNVTENDVADFIRDLSNSSYETVTRDTFGFSKSEFLYYRVVS